MKARWNGKISEMRRDNEWIYLKVTVTGSVLEGEGVRGQDAKATGAEIELHFKPVVADNLKFGQELHFTISTEKPEE
jgi:hypothetical protein